jgi:quinol monooxygenase YgiN
MATLLAHIKIREGMEARFEQVAAELHRLTHEHETGVRRYEYWRGAEPGSYYTLLAFDDYLAFLRHQTSEHHEAASPALRDLIADMRLEWVDPIEGSSPLPATNSQALPAGASELEQAYAQTFAADVQPWWLPLR